MDGTWQNIAAGDKLTNVGRIALDVRPVHESVQQLVFYSPGIGAETFLGKAEDRIFKGATGEGAEEQIVTAYLFLSLNFTPGDEIFLFGFSRGAFCCRSLAGLIRACGIVRREHADKVREAFEVYRRNVQQDPSAEQRRREFRENYAIAPVYEPKMETDQSLSCSIAYMGVFDTVVMRGVIRPNAKATVHPKYAFHDLKLGDHVKSARQALAVDERRNTLKPTFWSNLEELNRALGRDPQDPEAPYQQKWFTGAHGDVGGGMSDELSEVSRKWVKAGAERAGLSFDGEPLTLSREAEQFVFLRGQIETPKGLLNIGGLADRLAFPEPIDPSEEPATMMGKTMKLLRAPFQPRSEPSAEDLARLVHVSALMRAFAPDLSPRYRPKTLAPLVKALEADEAARSRFLAKWSEGL